METMLTVTQAARKLGCSEQWLRDSAAKGKIPQPMRDINGWRRYTKADIEEIARILFPPRQVKSK